MGFLLVASLLAGLALGFILLAEHLFFWPERRRLTQVESYVVGVASGWLVFIPLSFALEIPEAALAYLVMYVVGGSFTIIAWRTRSWAEGIRRTGQRQGQLSAEAPPLTQDRIDEGGQ